MICNTSKDRNNKNLLKDKLLFNVKKKQYKIFQPRKFTQIIKILYLQEKLIKSGLKKI